MTAVPPPYPTVFVVDDDRFMRGLLQRVFEAAAIPVRVFESAADLLANADLQSRCVLLLDVSMPGMSGPELHALLRERGVDAPVMFLTAAADVPMAVTAMRNGAADFLEKPFLGDVLVARVHHVFARFRAPAPVRRESVAVDRLETLTPREREVLELMVTGVTSKRIARILGGSFRTIEIHRGRVLAKMAADSLADLVRINLELQSVTQGTPQRPS